MKQPQLFTILLAIVIVLFSFDMGYSQTPFTPGNIVVYRVGDGVGTLATTGNPVFLDEYTTSGALVQSIPLPTTVLGSNKPLVASGTASSEGLLNRSVDGQYLILTGYATTIPYATSIVATTSTVVPRVIGTVSAGALINTTTALTDVASTGNPRSACSTDGNALWVSGSSGGAHYTTLGSTTSTQLATAPTNLRALSIFGGQLYTSANTTTYRLATIGTGLPITSGQTITNLPGFPTSTGSPYGFFFADLDVSVPGVDVVYVADDGGTLQKYSLVAGNWVANGTITVAAIRDITGSVAGTTVTLYGATSTTTLPYTSNIISFTDASGYNATITGSVTTIATLGASSTKVFRGIAFAPVSPGVTAPTIQTSNFTFSNIQQTQMDVSWTVGNGSKRVVKINTINSFTLPADGSDPTANAVYAGSGEQVIFNGSGTIVPTVTGLSAGTTYWFQAWEYNGTGSGTKYCSVSGANNPLSQATAASATKPVVTSPTATSITTTSAVLGGNITADGGSGITERGTVWSLTTPVTIADNKLAEGGTTTGIFSHLRSTMPSNTLIHYAAYAINGVGTTLSAEDSFTTLQGEPTNHVTNFTAGTATQTTIPLTWTDATGDVLPANYLIKGSVVSYADIADPVDGTPEANALLVQNVAQGVGAYTFTTLAPSTPYYFKIYPYTNSGLAINYKTSPVVPQATATTAAPSVNNYAWIGADNGLWTDQANWSPARTLPLPNDLLMFNDGTTKTITGVPTQTIGRLLMTNNTIVNLQSSAPAVLTIAGGTGIDLVVSAGCALNCNAPNAITIALLTGATGSITGNMTFSSTVATAHRLTAVDAGSVTFGSGSTFTAGTFFSGNAFGTTNLLSIIFASGSTYIHVAGSNPFGAGQPASVIVFQTGSLYKLISGGTPSFSGRTYANFEMDATAASSSPNGTGAVSIDNLTITNGTLNFNMTGAPGHSIKGNIYVAGGATLNFAPVTDGSVSVKGNIQVAGTLNFSPTISGTVVLNGTSTQTISGSGAISGTALATTEVANSSGVILNMPMTLNGTLKLTSGLLTLGSNLTLGPASTISGTPSASNMIVADGTGQLRKGFAATGSFTFPVGDNTGTAEYSPVTLNFASGTFATGNYAGVNLINAKYPGDPNSGSYLNRYWNLAQTGITDFSCAATFQYVPADVSGTEGDIFCVKVLPTPFIQYDNANTIVHQLTANGLTTFSTFTGTVLLPPTVVTDAATGVGSTTATLNGTVNANYQTTNVSFEYGPTNTYGTTVQGVPATLEDGTTTAIAVDLTGLTQNTEYHFRINGTSGAGTSNGSDMTFKTTCPFPGDAGAITGPATVCANSTEYQYSVPPIPNATSYVWSFPSGATIVDGLGYNNVTVIFAPGSVSGPATVHGTNACGDGVESPTLDLTVNQPVAVGITISASDNPVFAGTSVTFTATPVNEGLVPSYQWQVNTIVINGATDATYTFVPANNDAVACVLTSSLGCTTGNPATSNTVTMTVNPLVPVDKTVSGVVNDGETMCYNATQTITVGGIATPFTVKANGSATMIAGVNIIYLPGTTVELNGYMLGKITSPTGPFCPGQPAAIVKVTTGEEELSFSTATTSFKIYPNPTTGDFTLEQKGEKVSGDVNVEIYGMTGEKILSSKMTSERKHQFSLSGAPFGIYFVKIVAGDVVETTKLIKQ